MIGAGRDELADRLALVLTAPAQHLYALLWRLGVLDVDA
ncbi:hypothetical protein PBI_ZOEJ_58 [Mycobacterium phage ZoeJ]|uniref:Uncharacterized protein n=1 Tax=Mycobacterium phage ZoeJ TaxID=1486427 RepID=A0A023W6Y3_9CAUD|nr:hypothetical protein PBI_ZOEJ_58 [Mycobacterium phage ZoeJ]AHY26882.1 hypothetical protein PBI_ZOEJ_58 [Mycobacterium phage ZoeJ]AOZ64396.1 hypothetical protein SEA_MARCOLIUSPRIME_59 [Mycobacterium phage Marcoliusprime]ASR86602.1 hypothetical protein SEA_DISMALFUNK_59 [Mycobacterium phage DismalFunk]AYB69013.1 hypothetical protein SEA_DISMALSTRESSOR_59 [Mycobacterium phage DismalStressor]